jgi:hypothetical protein
MSLCTSIQITVQLDPIYKKARYLHMEFDIYLQVVFVLFNLVMGLYWVHSLDGESDIE